jgi:hypothetical protein
VASLDSARNKIIRAKVHRDAFVAEANRHFNGNSCEVTVDFDFPKNIAPHLSVEIPVPAQLSLIIGDCLQNIRSSLDYLVRELVLAAHGEPNAQHTFPVCETPGAFKNTKRKRLSGLSEDAIAEIEALQPYVERERLRDHPFWILDKLCNINKHRRILLTRLRAGMAGKRAGLDDYAFIIPWGTDLPKVDVSIELVAYVSFDERGIAEGGEACSLLSQIIAAVERVLPNFDRFF